MIRGPPRLSRQSGNKKARTSNPSTSFKRKTRFRTSKIPNALSFGKYTLPLRVQNQMHYASTTPLAFTAPGTAQMAIRCNGIFDPEVALGGHQPLYFDQLSALYNHYTVIASKITVRTSPDFGGGNTRPYMVTLIIDDDNNVNIGAQNARERPGARSHLVNPSEADKGLTSYWNAQRTFGGNVIDNPDLQGSSTTDPAEQSQWHIFLDGGVLDQVVDVFVDVTYTVVWDELKSIPIS